MEGAHVFSHKSSRILQIIILLFSFGLALPKVLKRVVLVRCLKKTNHENRDASESVNNDRGALFKPTKEHCLMCIKNNISPHLMHPNIDVDIIVSEEPPYGSTQKPEYLYRVIEHLIQGRRRIAIFGEDHNLQLGWLTVGNGLFSSNFSKENFADAERNVWEGGYGCTASPNAPHLIFQIILQMQKEMYGKEVMDVLRHLMPLTLLAEHRRLKNFVPKVHGYNDTFNKLNIVKRSLHLALC